MEMLGNNEADLKERVAYIKISHILGNIHDILSHIEPY